MKVHDWVSISKFGKKSDNNAWLLVQHADLDPDFQREVLQKLAKLWPKGETDATNYAYLYDRVATSWQDKNKRKRQRYGTQGKCVGKGQWEPLAVEDPANLEKRRKSVGLNTMDEYKAMFKNLCQ